MRINSWTRPRPGIDMENPKNWALAFVGAMETEGADLDEGIFFMEILSAWAASLPGRVSGKAAAVKLEKIIRKGLSQTLSPAGETALRLLVLMCRKGMVHRAAAIISEAKKLRDKKQGILEVHAESAFPMEADMEERIKAEMIKQTGAKMVRMSSEVNGELIGGYRLMVGDLLLDGSIKKQLQRMESFLSQDVDI